MAGTNKAGTKLANIKYSYWTVWLDYLSMNLKAGLYFLCLNLTRMLFSLLSLSLLESHGWFNFLFNFFGLNPTSNVEGHMGPFMSSR